MQELTILERPRGIVKALACLGARPVVRFTDLVRLGMTRWAATRSIDSLVQMGIMVPLRASNGKKSERWYAATMHGMPLVEVAGAVFEAMQRLEGKSDPGRLMRLPSGSFLVLARIASHGQVWHAQVVGELGLCRGSAAGALRALHEAGLVEVHPSRGFPPRTLYEATEKGRQLGLVLTRSYSVCKSLCRDRTSAVPFRGAARGRLQWQSDLYDFTWKSPTEGWPTAFPSAVCQERPASLTKMKRILDA